MLNQETAKAARTDSGYILRAPRRMRVADAVAQYMRVPMGAGNSVPWDPLVAPYVIEPMNCLASREYDAVIFVGPARTGKTIGLIDGWVIYNVICDPADMLIIQMTEEKAREHSKKRLARTFRVSPEVVSRLSPNKNDNNVYDRTFLAGNYLKIGWPSVNIMSSSDYKCVALTDYDRFPEDIDGEGDAFSLASKRTTTFMSSGMTLVESSPGRDVKDVKWRRTSPHEAPPTTGILSLYNRGDRRRWYWPCPHCGEYFQPCGDVVAGFRDIADPVLASEAAYIQCPSCSGRIMPEQKRELNGRGVWLRDGESINADGSRYGDPRRSRIASFWMEGPAAAYQTLSQLVYKLLTAEQEYETTGSEETLKTVINTDWGLPYLPRASMEQRKSELLEQRAEPVPSRSVPDGVNFLVATVDVQAGRHRRFVVQVTGYGSRGERWIIDRYNITQSLRGDSDGESQRIDPASYPEDWDVLLTDVFHKSWPLSGAECLAHGFADQVTPAVKAMACIQSKRTEEFTKMPESIRNMITPPRNSAPRVQDNEPAASRTPVQAAAPVVDENSIRAQVLAEQKARVNGINDLFAMFGGRYQTLQAQCLADPECSLEQAREKLLNEMGRESTPSNKNTPAHIYAGNGNFVGDGIRQALMARAGFEKTERDNVYNGMTLREYARMSLTERGIGVSGYNPMQMVGAAFTHSTSDFGNILLDVANKAILQGWEDAPETYEQWTRKGQLSDFKIAHRVGMGGFSALRQVREGAEYKYVTTGDKQATIALATYGELFSITRQAIINDDLNMLTDVPMKLGRAAKSTIADLVYAILTSNPKISTDNVSLFDKAKHANVLEGAAMDVASLDKARQLMRVQKEGERHLNIRPAFVLVPTAMESVANQVIRSSSVKGADINAGIINPVKDFATVIAEPRLDDNSQTTFYLAASKGSDTIEVAYLNGVDTPYIDQMEGFSVDGVTTKVRIDAGVAPVDHRGLVKCTA
ncbi:ClpP-like prohead protease/major capsid protein fusion protein [Escherichia coli]|nr:ClpP-like prohead protease/major capsid protein fusion protein [Escherichia coli]MBN6377920.1 phage terminase large subunit family protein [Escherichia coli]